MSIRLRSKNWWTRLWDGPQVLKGFVHIGTFQPGDGNDEVAADAAFNRPYVPGAAVDPLQLRLQQATANLELLSDMRVKVSQLKFLLSQAPMHMAPEDRFRATQSSAPFAYIHPKTFVQYQERPVRAYGKVVGSKTKWVMTSLMPEGHVIYSPNPIPGIEKLLES
jgi:hypothetical protein